MINLLIYSEVNTCRFLWTIVIWIYPYKCFLFCALIRSVLFENRVPKKKKEFRKIFWFKNYFIHYIQDGCRLMNVFLQKHAIFSRGSYVKSEMGYTYFTTVRWYCKLRTFSLKISHLCVYFSVALVT